MGEIQSFQLIDNIQYSQKGMIKSYVWEKWIFRLTFKKVLLKETFNFAIWRLEKSIGSFVIIKVKIFLFILLLTMTLKKYTHKQRHAGTRTRTHTHTHTLKHAWKVENLCVHFIINSFLKFWTENPIFGKTQRGQKVCCFDFKAYVQIGNKSSLPHAIYIRMYHSTATATVATATATVATPKTTANTTLNSFIK